MTSVWASRLSGPAPKPHHINPGLHQSSVEWPHSLPFSLKPQDISQSLRTITWMLEHPNLTPLGAPSIPNDRDERFPSQNEDLKGCICAQALEPLEYTSLTINSQHRGTTQAVLQSPRLCFWQRTRKALAWQGTVLQQQTQDEAQRMETFRIAACLKTTRWIVSAFWISFVGINQGGRKPSASS